MDTNRVEQSILEQYPCLGRIKSSQKPPELSIVLIKNHNPDFTIFEPPYRGIYVELKGHIVDRMWFPMLESMPPWLKERYKVILASSGRKEADKYAERLDKIGIDHSYMSIKTEWITQAYLLFEENRNLEMEISEPTQFTSTKRGRYVIGGDSCITQTSPNSPQQQSLSLSI